MFTKSQLKQVRQDIKNYNKDVFNSKSGNRLPFHTAHKEDIDQYGNRFYNIAIMPIDVGMPFIPDKPKRKRILPGENNVSMAF